MKILTVVCVILAAISLAAICFLIYLLIFNSRLNRRLSALNGAPKAQAEVIQQALDQTRGRPLRNSLMLGLCAKYVEAGEEKRAVELFPFIRAESLFLDKSLYADLYDVLQPEEKNAE